MTIATEHAGYPILYDEKRDVWRCEPLALNDAKLSALRDQIDAATSRTRRMDARAFLLDHSGFSITPVRVVLIEADGNAWVVDTIDDPRNERRERVSLHRLVEDTMENRTLLLAWRDASRAVYEEGQRVAKLRDSIPRMDAPPPGGE
jgi:hypothetical protein